MDLAFRTAMAEPAATGIPSHAETEIADRFAVRWCRTTKFDVDRRQWRCYDAGGRFLEDRARMVMEMVRDGVRETAASLPLSAAAKIASARTIGAVELLLRHDQRHVVRAAQFDADPFALNTPAGVVDLRTGGVRPHGPDLLLTKMTAAIPTREDSGLWRAFLEDITCGNVELAQYLQRVFGYFITGDISEHILLWLVGVGANGKSVFTDAIRDALGDYARVIPAATLMETRGERHPTEIASLAGVRVAISSEVSEGQRLDEAKVKSLTGDAILAARQMRTDFFEFPRTHKHVVAGNYRPVLRSADQAMRRRIRIVPFEAVFAGERMDPRLPEKLRAVGGETLQWLIDGAIAWQREGLDPPSIVRDASDGLIEDQDWMGIWLGDCCDVSDPAARCPSKVLYESYRRWAEDRGDRPVTQTMFGEKLAARGFRGERSSTMRSRAGITLRSSAGL